MNTFELTEAQEYHWQVMQDKELVKKEGSGSSSDKRMAQFSDAHIDSEPSKRLHFFRKQKREEGKFYSLGGTARHLRYNYNRKDGARSVGEFTAGIEEATFDDPDLVRMLYTLHAEILKIENKSVSKVGFETLIDESDTFIEGAVQAKFDYNDSADSAMAKHSHAQIYFQTFLAELAQKIDKYG